MAKAKDNKKADKPAEEQLTSEQQKQQLIEKAKRDIRTLLVARTA